MDKLLVTISVIPKSKENRIVGLTENGILKLKVSAPPSDGQANEAVIKVISMCLNIPKSRIEIIKGLSSRQKVVCIRQWTYAQFQEALSIYLSKQL